MKALLKLLLVLVVFAVAVSANYVLRKAQMPPFTSAAGVAFVMALLIGWPSLLMAPVAMLTAVYMLNTALVTRLAENLLANQAALAVFALSTGIVVAAALVGAVAGFILRLIVRLLFFRKAKPKAASAPPPAPAATPTPPAAPAPKAP
ncbi:MAG: hypothetical protein Q7T26_00620 [Dehalococcoidia bacterium]|nr:hypothetical protein [Dehalococcoidia bacterium]